MVSEYTRTNQGGSVASFVIGGIILLAVVIGGLYFLNKRGESPSSAPIASKSVSPSVTAPASSPQSSPSPSPRPSQSPVIAAPDTKTPLPATGPTDLLPTGIVIAVLTGVSVSYVRSRRAYNR